MFSQPDGRARGWHEARVYAERLLAPGFGKPQQATYPVLHPSDDVVAATVDVRDAMEGYSKAFVALFREGAYELVREGSRPVYSPDGTRLAHIGEGGVHLDDALIELEGVAERLAWNPGGNRLLVVLAEPGAQMSNIAAGGVLPASEPWLPSVSSPTQHFGWRRLIVIDAMARTVSQVGRELLNVWDAAWAGDDTVVAVCTDGSPTEGAWYAADVRRIEVASGDDKVVVRPEMQLGAIAGSPSGARIAYVEAVCSDRDIAAGELYVVELGTGDRVRVDTPADVTDVHFIDDQTLGFCGMRNLTTVVGTATVDGVINVLWQSERDSIPGIHPHASFRAGRVAFVTGGQKTPPAVQLLREGAMQTLASLAHAGSPVLADAAWTSEHRTWLAPDGLEIDGWLFAPEGSRPQPVVTWIHGGPLWSHRSGWMGLSMFVPYLLERGYAVFLPNPRGSSGKGLEFGRRVVNDMGGADTHDIVSGVESLVDAGIADPSRLVVTGGSYGGYMTAWLVTQTDLFKAAVAQYPITDWRIQHGACSIPDWDEGWLDGDPYADDGQYRTRSPLTFADKVVTPTLFIAGAHDGCVPPAQALAMHRALVAHGVASECVIYPEEGHGSKNLSTQIDTMARLVDWFDHFVGTSS